MFSQSRECPVPDLHPEPPARVYGRPGTALASDFIPVGPASDSLSVVPVSQERKKWKFRKLQLGCKFIELYYAQTLHSVLSMSDVHRGCVIPHLTHVVFSFPQGFTNLRGKERCKAEYMCRASELKETLGPGGLMPGPALGEPQKHTGVRTPL